VPVDVRALGVDSLAVSAHKLHGPKGAGALWLRKGARLAPLWAGGGQQGGLRSGTQNVSGAAALGEAARLACASLPAAAAAWRALGEQLLGALAAAGIDAQLHAARAPRATHIWSVGFARVPAEPLLHALEARGVIVSAGSACASRPKGPSPILQALGVRADVGTLRFSFSRDTTADDVAAAAAAVAAAIHSL
jgi:cysteine desulfurase